MARLPFFFFKPKIIPPPPSPAAAAPEPSHLLNNTKPPHPRLILFFFFFFSKGSYIYPHLLLVKALLYHFMVVTSCAFYYKRDATNQRGNEALIYSGSHKLLPSGNKGDGFLAGSGKVIKDHLSWPSSLVHNTHLVLISMWAFPPLSDSPSSQWNFYKRRMSMALAKASERIVQNIGSLPCRLRGAMQYIDCSEYIPPQKNLTNQ